MSVFSNIEVMLKILKKIWKTTKNPVKKVIRVLLFLVRQWIFDTMYYGVTREEFSKAVQEYKKWIDEHELVWTSDRFDCDDFAVTFKAIATSILKKNSVGIAIGALYKDKQLLGGHAYNVVLFDDGTIMFFEPQTQELFEWETYDGYRYELITVIW